MELPDIRGTFRGSWLARQPPDGLQLQPDPPLRHHPAKDVDLPTAQRAPSPASRFLPDKREAESFACRDQAG